MANPDHVKELLKGVEHWNEWLCAQREQDPYFCPDLRDFDISYPDFKDSELVSFKQYGRIDLFEISLTRADLKWANLKGTNLNKACLKGADLQGAHLEEAILDEAHLEEAILDGAHFEGATLQMAYLEGADLTGVHFDGADLSFADLRECNLARVKFDRRGRYRGVRLDGAYGNQRFQRFAMDQAYIEELRISPLRRDRLFYLFWLYSSDCGRSFLLWSGCSILMAFIFGCIYSILGKGVFHAVHLFSIPNPNGPGGSPAFWALQYYSIVTFTTLGFGDIVPKTGLAAFFVTLEVIFGYVMLGGLISIFANKLARRSG